MMCLKFLGLRRSGRSLPFIRKLQAYQIFRWVTASASLGGLKLPWVGSWKHLVTFQSSQFLPKWALIDSDCPHELTCSIFCPNSMAILGVLTVAVKAWCSFKVVSYARSIFGDPNSTKVLDLPFLKEVSHKTWSWHPCPANLVTLTAQKLPHPPFLSEVSHEMVSLETSRATLSSLWASQIALLVARCPFWGRLRMLAQPSRHFGHIGSLSSSSWHGAACRIVVVAARCSFWDRSRNPLVTYFAARGSFWVPLRNPLGTLSVSDRSRCGAVLISIVKEILCRDLGKEVFYRELAQRSCHGYLLLLLLLLFFYY